jgi:hypothetical protein
MAVWDLNSNLDVFSMQTFWSENFLKESLCVSSEKIKTIF